MKQKINIWGINICPYEKKYFIEIIDLHIKSQTGKPLHISAINPETLAHASKNKELYNSIKSSDLINVDNYFVFLVLRILGKKIPERVATPDLFEEMLRLSEKNNYSIYILGSKEDVLLKAIENIKSEYPAIKIVGFRDGYYSREQEEDVVLEIKSKQVDMLFVAMSSPYKEIFINRYKNNLDVQVLLGVGGAIDVKAGIVKRAPLFIREIGLEGFHRSLQNPMNYGKRYFTLYPLFLKLVLSDLFSKNKKNEK